MKKETKNRKNNFKDVNLSKTYSPMDAIKLLKEKSYVKFEETLDIAIKLGIDSSKTDENIRGVVNLPKGSGKKIVVAVMAKGDKAKEASEAGADLVGVNEMVEKVANWVKYEQDDEIGAIYGLPRGGLPIAVSLSHRLNLPLLMNYYDRKVVTNKKILVVDDIADTGQTLEDFDNEHNIICTFHYHKQSLVKPNYYVEEKGDDWIVYPWETEDSEEIQDYLKEEVNEN